VIGWISANDAIVKTARLIHQRIDLGQQKRKPTWAILRVWASAAMGCQPSLTASPTFLI
jgi:hypothetical protein